MVNEKSTNQVSGVVTYWRLMRYLLPYLGLFIISIIGFMVYASTQPMLAGMMELFVDGLGGKDIDLLKWLPNRDGYLGKIIIAIGQGDLYQVSEGIKVAYFVPVL
ncbi:MAG: hypothetical protein KUG73_10100, partial [Pseudomonadales bacterium]|nr:hypothetical protein [Pseudomonadales bacterium]